LSDQRHNTPNTYTENIRNKQTTFTYLGDQFKSSFSEVTSVIAIPFTNDGELVAVKTNKRGWDLPGGHVEKDEVDPIETLNREVMEEACMTVRNPLLVEVIESDFFDDRKTYMLIYVVLVDKIFDFEATDEICERQLMDVEEFMLKYHANDNPAMKQTLLNAQKRV